MNTNKFFYNLGVVTATFIAGRIIGAGIVFAIPKSKFDELAAKYKNISQHVNYFVNFNNHDLKMVKKAFNDIGIKMTDDDKMSVIRDISAGNTWMHALLRIPHHFTEFHEYVREHNLEFDPLGGLDYV